MGLVEVPKVPRGHIANIYVRSILIALNTSVEEANRAWDMVPEDLWDDVASIAFAALAAFLDDWAKDCEVPLAQLLDEIGLTT